MVGVCAWVGEVEMIDAIRTFFVRCTHVPVMGFMLIGGSDLQAPNI